jgi:hypothetical protein
MNREPIDSKVVRCLLNGAVPERKTEITALLAEIRPQFFLHEDRGTLCFHAKDAEIAFSHETMRLFWLLGFVGWRIFRAYCPAVLWGTATAQRVSDLIKQDQGFQEAEVDFKMLLLAARALEGAESAAALEWPAGIPEPQADKSKISDVQDQAAFDLYVGAATYAFLHELRHVWHYRQPSRPSDWTEEEIDCDVFARSFIMDKIAVFAEKTGYPFDKLVNKRAMGIALGAWIVYEITPPLGRGGTRTHPPIADRLEALIKNMPARQDADFWVWTCTLLMAATRHRNHPVDPVFDNPEALAMDLIEKVRQMA